MENFFLLSAFLKYLPPELVNLFSTFDPSNGAPGERQYFYANGSTGEIYHSTTFYPPASSMSLIGGYAGLPMSSLGLDIPTRNQYITSFMLGDVNTTDEIKERIKAEYPDGLDSKLYPAYLLSEVNRDLSNEDIAYKNILQERVTPHLNGNFRGVMLSVSSSRTHITAICKADCKAPDNLRLQVSYMLINGVHAIFIGSTNTTNLFYEFLKSKRYHSIRKPDGVIKVLFRYHIVSIRNRMLVLSPAFINSSFIKKWEEFKAEGSAIAALADLSDRLNTALSLLTPTTKPETKQ